MSDDHFLRPGAEVEIRRLDDSGAGQLAKVAGAGDQPGDFKLRWKEAGGIPAGAPKVGALVRLIRRAPAGDATAVRALVEAVGPNGLIVHTSGTVTAYEKRGYDRVDVSFPMTYRKLTDAEVTELRSEIVGASAAAALSAAPASATAPALASGAGTPAQQRIERKLDLILSHLGLSAETSRTATSGPTAIGRKGATALDLSGSGLRVRVSEPLSPGDQLEVRFDVPGGQGVRVRALLEIVRQIADNGRSHEVGGRFRTMSESARTAVVRYVFDAKRDNPASSLRKAG